jgi:putative SOS response-associated peptidase YedK
MCGRYLLSQRKQIVEEYFDAHGDEGWSQRYNIAPTQPVPSFASIPTNHVACSL